MNENWNVISRKKAECSREYKKLKLQEEFLEKSIFSMIKMLKIDADSIFQIGDDRIEAHTKRQPNMQEMTEATLDVFKELKWLKSSLQEAEPSVIKNLDVSDCRFRLTKLSNKIESFNSDKTGFEKLKKEEDALNSDLREFERTILTEKTVKSAPKINKDKKCQTRLDVNDGLTQLVARTGHTQGWTDEDHSLFLKIRNKHDSVPQLVIELRKRRPHLTNEEIVNHEAWHKLYTELRDKRKKEIADWRSKNKQQRNVKINSSVKRLEPKNDKDVKKLVFQSPETCENDSVGKKKKMMIDEWRAEKARKLAMDEEQRKRLEKAKLDEENRRRDNKRSEIKIKLKNYRDEKAKNSRDQSRSASHINLKDAGNQTSHDSLRLIKSFREQDERFIEKRLKCLKLSPKNDVKEFSKRVSNKLRENSTLLSPTKGWEEKCKREIIIKTEDIFERVNYVKDIQRLSGSRWREQRLSEC